MNRRRVETFMMLAVLLIVNGFIFLWLQGRPISAAWASGLAEPAAPAAIPPSFSYQGTLRDASGALVNDQVDLTLRLYKDVTGGEALHSESYSSINVRDGVFSVVVGDSGTTLNPAIFANAAVYLGIAVNGDAEMLPRQRLHPVPWAMQASTALTAVDATNADHAVNADNATTAQSLVTGGSAPSIAGNVAIDGDLTVTGKQALGNNVTTKAIHHVGDSNGQIQKGEYDVSINRYVVEAEDNGASPDTVVVDDTILLALCADEDGCSVTMGMRNWDTNKNGQGLLVQDSGAPYRFSIAEEKSNGERWWRLGNNEGADGNGAVDHLYHVWDCYFTDGKYLNGSSAGDNELGFGLLNWKENYTNPDMVCVLIIED